MPNERVVIKNNESKKTVAFCDLPFNNYFWFCTSLYKKTGSNSESPNAINVSNMGMSRFNSNDMVVPVVDDVVVTIEIE